MYGFRDDRMVCDTMTRNSTNALLPRVKQLKRVYPFYDTDALYGVEACLQGLPHFMTWQNDNVLRKQVLSAEDVIQKLSPYAANMSEEELAFFLPVFNQLVTLYTVQHVQCYPDAVELAILVSGKPKLLIVQVLNMAIMDYDSAYSEYGMRWTLN